MILELSLFIRLFQLKIRPRTDEFRIFLWAMEVLPHIQTPFAHGYCWIFFVNRIHTFSKVSYKYGLSKLHGFSWLLFPSLSDLLYELAQWRTTETSLDAMCIWIFFATVIKTSYMHCTSISIWKSVPSAFVCFANAELIFYIYTEKCTLLYMWLVLNNSASSPIP